MSQVNKDSPAEKAGLKAGDIIVRYDGKEVRNTRELRNLVAATAPGTRVELGVIQNGKHKTLDVTIGRMPAETAATPPRQSRSAADRLAGLGLSVQTLTPDLARQFDLQADSGVLIVNVEPGSSASTANPQPGDVIVEVNRVRVTSVGDLQKMLEQAKDRALLLVNRKGVTAFVVLQLSWR